MATPVSTAKGLSPLTQAGRAARVRGTALRKSRRQSRRGGVSIIVAPFSMGVRLFFLQAVCHGERTIQVKEKSVVM